MVKNTFRTFISVHYPKLLSVGFFALLFSAYIYAFANPPASPYQGGITLDPTCAPGDVNCFVQIIPDQTGNNGKYLTTDGSTTSWTTIPPFVLSNGSGTTANGSAVDLGGTTTGSTLINASGGSFEISTGTVGLLLYPSPHGTYYHSTVLGDFNVNGNGTLLRIHDDVSTAYFTNTNNDVKFGINTNAPSVALDVLGSISSSGIIKVDSGNISDIYIKDDLNMGRVGLFASTGSDLVLASTDLTKFYYGDNNLVVDGSNGRVGIGTTVPQTQLDINGSITFRGNIIAGTDNTYDIGASGTTRPRTGYFGTSVNVPLIQMGGTTASFPEIKRNGTAINFRLADDSADAPITAGQLTAPLLIGGTGVTSTLIYKTTTGVGTTGADHIFQVGNNGATEAMRIFNNGDVSIGTASNNSYKLDVNGGIRATGLGRFQTGGMFYGNASPDAGVTGQLLIYTSAGSSFVHAYNGASYSNLQFRGSAFSFYTGQGSYGQMSLSNAGTLTLNDSNTNTANVTLNNLDAATYKVDATGTSRFATAVQTPLVYGDTAANGDITINGTSNATKTTSYVQLQTDNTSGAVLIGTAGGAGIAAQRLQVDGGATGVVFQVTGNNSFNPGLTTTYAGNTHAYTFDSQNFSTSTGGQTVLTNSFLQLSGTSYIQPYQQNLRIIRTYPGTGSANTLEIDNTTENAVPGTYRIALFKLSGVDKAYIDQTGGAWFSGNVGVGTASPTGKFQLGELTSNGVNSYMVIGHNGTTSSSNDGTSTIRFASQFSNYPYTLGAEGNGYNFYLRQNNTNQGAINMDFSGTGTLVFQKTATSLTQPIDITTDKNFNLYTSGADKYLAIFSSTSSLNGSAAPDNVYLARPIVGSGYERTSEPVVTIRNGLPSVASDNVVGNKAYWYRNGYIGIGTANTDANTTNPLKAALTINQGTLTGYANNTHATASNVKTVGSSTTVSFTPDNGNSNVTYGIIVGSKITANSITRTVTSVSQGQVVVDSAVDWSNGGSGYPFTYRNPYINISDGTNPIFSVDPSGSAIFTPTVSTGTGSTAGMQILANSLTTGNGLDISSSSITAGNLVSFSSTSTGAASNTQTILNISTSGANPVNQTTYGGYFSNTHTGTNSVNTALYATASGGSSNYAANFGATLLMSATSPCVSFQLGTCSSSDNFINRSGTQVTVQGSGAVQLAVGGTSYLDAVTSKVRLFTGGSGEVLIGTSTDAGAFSLQSVGNTYINPNAYANAVGGLTLARSGNFTGVAAETALDLSVKPSLTLTEPGSGTFTWNGGDIDMSSIAVTAGAGTTVLNALRLAGVSDADVGTVRGLFVANLSATAATEEAIHTGTGWDYAAIFEAGNVGIQNTAPGFALHVGSSATTDSTTLIRLEDANSTCDFNANAGGPTCGSDVTLKKDITSLDNTDILNRVSQLNPVSYHWLTDDSSAGLQYGFIAQEVEAQFPNLVSEHTWIDGSTKKFLNMGGLVPYLAGAIKELDIKVKGLSSLDITDSASLGSLVKQFLADVGNGIESIFVKKIHTEELCVKKSDGSEICVTGDQLDHLINGTTTTSGGGGSSGGGTPPPTATDICPNIDGDQATVPDGMHLDDTNNCVANDTPPPTDTGGSGGSGDTGGTPSPSDQPQP